MGEAERRPDYGWTGLRLLASLLVAAVRTCSGVQAFTDFVKHVVINPRAMVARTCHPSQSHCARSDRRSGFKPCAAIGTVDLVEMRVTQAFDDLCEPDGNLFT